MKSYLLLSFVPAILVGCSSQGTAPAPTNPGETAQQSLEKIQNDPKMPEGLKKIQAATLQSQPGSKPPSN
jgi:hypothetical protein